ncbi:hypothetical protein ACFSM5_11245 [Lacibacterium aquatile]|uniref:Site-specific integrase n=1 Tax=Lacibacterium aquatile TaxID=1168082 RepID=A0ABW5DRQ0_9PROT
MSRRNQRSVLRAFNTLPIVYIQGNSEISVLGNAMLATRDPAKPVYNTKLRFALELGKFLNYVNDRGLDLRNLPEQAFWDYFKHTADQFELERPDMKVRARITVQQERYMLWELFRLAGERGIVKNTFPPPTMRVRDGVAVPDFNINGLPPAEAFVPEEEEMEAIVSRLPEVYQLVADCMLDTAGRFDEVRQVFTETWALKMPSPVRDGQKRSVLHVPVTVKGKRPGWLRVSHEGAKAFKALWQLPADEKKRITNKNINQALLQACLDHNLLTERVLDIKGTDFSPPRQKIVYVGDRMTSHSFRHFYASLFMKQYGKATEFNPIEALQKILHHLTPETTWHYVHALGLDPNQDLRPQRVSFYRGHAA